MSNLYLSAETDMLKTLRTARAKDWISVWLHFDDYNHGRAVRVRMYREGNDEDKKRVLRINGRTACEIDREKGIMVCDLKGRYNFNNEIWEV